MTLNEIIEKLKLENARSKEIHGPWADMPDVKQFEAIHGEFIEWLDAYLADDIHGDHGEIAELIQVANVCIRRVMALTGERDA